MKYISPVALVVCLFCFSALAAETKPILAPAASPATPMATQEESFPTYSQLSEEDRLLLRKGEISQAQLLAGGFLGTFIGFGSGHLPYQMWREKGWIFTAGEPAALALAILGATGINNDCTRYSNYTKCDDVGGSRAALAIGLIGFIGLRVWEIIDVWTIPSARNYEVRAVRQKMGRELTRSSWSISPIAFQPKGTSQTLPGLEFRAVF